MYNIVGAGLSGSFVAKELDNNNIPYRIFDSNEPFAASRISENLFSPTWLKGIEYLDPSIKWLTKNYEIQNKRFKTNKTYQNVFYLPIDKVLRQKYILKKVTKLSNDGLYCGSEHYQGINIICAGYYSKKLIKIDALNSLSGHGLLFEPNETNIKLEEVMRHYRPFTHEKVMKWHDGRIWYGDSTAIIHQSYLKNQKQYIENTLQRAKKIGLTGKYNMYYGARPFMNNKLKKYGLYKKINDNNFVLTGGWKDGLIIYPYLVSKLMRDIKA